MTTEPVSATGYWEPLWAQGRRYWTVAPAESRLLENHLGADRGRPALDLGCGECSLTRRLTQLGYRSTGIDCSPSAIALATDPCDAPGERCGCVHGHHHRRPQRPVGPGVRDHHLPFGLPVDQRQGGHSRSRKPSPRSGRHVLGSHRDRRRRSPTDPLQHLGITPWQAEILTAGWSTVRTTDLESNAHDLWIGLGLDAKGVPSRVIDFWSSSRPTLHRRSGRHARAERSECRWNDRGWLPDRRHRPRGGCWPPLWRLKSTPT
ncbi:class I SAM-dependent methyltransferase [Streptomyces sp. NBRC 110465]|uniref:class I SAM-dependent methyltransferase n=1 Tax=Streptomyces sp. NBRC 110465 TaxID=1897621 RepID=UPI00358EC165